MFLFIIMYVTDLCYSITTVSNSINIIYLTRKIKLSLITHNQDTYELVVDNIKTMELNKKIVEANMSIDSDQELSFNGNFYINQDSNNIKVSTFVNKQIIYIN